MRPAILDSVESSSDLICVTVVNRAGIPRPLHSHRTNQINYVRIQQETKDYNI